MASNTSDFYTYSKTAGTSKNLQKPLDGGDENVWGGYINTDLDTIVAAVNATSNLIADANENELIDFTATGSAVNHIGVTNAATGNPPQIASAGDDTNIDLTLAAKGAGDVNLTPGSAGDVNVPANKGITFGDDGEKIEGDGTDLTVASSNDLNLTATTDINLTATSDVNVPAQVGLTFGADTEKIEADGSNNMTHTAAGNITLDAAGDITLSADGDNINFDDGTTSRFGIDISTGDVTMTDTDAAGTLGPELTLYRDSSSPVASDLIGAISFAGEDDNDDNTTYARIQVEIKNVDHAGGNEAAEMQLQTRVSNALSTLLTIMSDGTVKTHGTLVIGG